MRSRGRNSVKHLTIKIVGGELRGTEIETAMRESTNLFCAVERAVHQERKRLHPGQRLQTWRIVPQAYNEPTYYLGVPASPSGWSVEATIRIYDADNSIVQPRVEIERYPLDPRDRAELERRDAAAFAAIEEDRAARGW